jgi:hypothetical protein
MFTSFIKPGNIEVVKKAREDPISAWDEGYLPQIEE